MQEVPVEGGKTSMALTVPGFKRENVLAIPKIWSHGHSRKQLNKKGMQCGRHTLYI